MIEDIRAQYKACEPFLSTASTLDEGALVKEAQIEALKSMAKNLLGIDLLDAKVAKERALGKDLTTAEELEAYESEIRKLRIDPQKLRKEEDAGKYQNKLVRERELERYLNKGWEMVQTVNSRILDQKAALDEQASVWMINQERYFVRSRLLDLLAPKARIRQLCTKGMIMRQQTSLSAYSLLFQGRQSRENNAWG